jgi:site-specific DNA-methyltransferase (adenine-specific)
MKLMQGDCLELMKDLPDNSVDMILADLPYGVSKCKWDSVIPFEPLWEQYRRVAKERAAIVLSAIQPFTSALVMSNTEMYRHHWIWNKNNSAGFALVKIRPFAVCEDVLVFGKSSVNYFPQMEERGKPRMKGGYNSSENYGITPSKSKNNLYYPKSLLNISNANQRGKTHPTQKPVALMEYLIKTYTNEGDTVLDNVMGSGTVGVACVNLNRHFIGMELDENYFNIAKERIEHEIIAG